MTMQSLGKPERAPEPDMDRRDHESASTQRADDGPPAGAFAHSRVVQPSAQAMYAAARRWRDEALVGDQSLFSGRTLDGRLAAAELARDFIAQPDVGEGDFVSKLRRQLASTSGDGVQVAAELLYVHCLVVSTESMKGKTKRELVDTVADFHSPETAPVPPDLIESLRGGVARPGQAYNNLRWKMLAYLIRVFGAVKAMPTEQRRQSVTDFDRFQDLLSGIDDRSVWSQRYALEHLLFPDVAPAVLSRDDRKLVVDELQDADAPADVSVHDVVNSLPPNVEYGGEHGLNLYRAPYRERWKGPDPHVEEYVNWARQLATAVDLDDIERDFKLERVPTILEAIDAAKDGQNPCPALRKALSGLNLVDFRVTDTFLSWAEGHPEATSRALAELADRPGPASIDRFLAGIPPEAAGATGARLSLASVLLMGLSPTEFPPWRSMAGELTRRLTNGSRPQESATDGEIYLLFLERLDTIMASVNAAEPLLRDRLDTQGLAWLVANLAVQDIPGWSTEDRAAFDAWRTGKPAPSPTVGLPAPEAAPEANDLGADDTLEALSGRLHMDSTEWLEETLTLLQRKRQLILQGPPGTGKTYIARALATYLAGSADRVTTVQFHPGTSYEDFVQGLRPDPDNPREFRVVDGPLMTISKDAAKHGEHLYVLLIDEINRGNVPAVFGELYFLLEYRDDPITLMYGDQHSLPENLLIIGTMNTADRSITALDSALRRRFYVRDLDPLGEPLQGVLRRYLEHEAPELGWLAELLDLANMRLEDRDLAIGPSHFMEPNLTPEWARRAWDYSVLPTLREYFHNRPERLSSFEFEALRLEVQGDDDDDSAAD